MGRIEEALKKAEELRLKKIEAPARGKQNQAGRPAVSCQSPGDISATALDNASPLIVALKECHSPAAEEYKKLRTAVLKQMAGNTEKVLLITSPENGNGKSCTSANLAVSFAALGQEPVLLVDADLRRPSVHKYFGIDPANGLSEYLSGKTGTQEIIRPSGIGALFIITAGTPPKNPSEMLSLERMRHFISGLKAGHRGAMIIFDSPPLLNAVDSIVLAQQTDGILLVIEAARTRPDAVKRSLGLLKGLPLIGAVFNNVPEYLSKTLHPYYY